MRQENTVLSWFSAKIWVLIFCQTWEHSCSQILLDNEIPRMALITKDLNSRHWHLEDKKEGEAEQVLKEIMAANFPNFAIDVSLWIQEAEQTPTG